MILELRKTSGNEIEKSSTKRDIVLALLTTLNSIIQTKFLSFVEKENELLKVICQIGEDTYIKSAFSPSMCKEIFNWVMNQKKSMSLKLTEKEQFIFVPIVDRFKNEDVEHGIVVLHISNASFELTKELNINFDALSKLASLALSKLLQSDQLEKRLTIQKQIESETSNTSSIFKIISGVNNVKKMPIAILEDKNSNHADSVYWVYELENGEVIVFLGTFNEVVNEVPKVILNAYFLGLINNLKSNLNLLLKPSEVLSSLNKGLNPIFKTLGISINAWYGVFDLKKKNVRFANANHADPFIIGSELQVSNLTIEKKEISLGINIDSVYTESYSNISSGSKLVICTKGLLDHASRLGDKYDPTWFPQVLETVGNLPVDEMCNSLECILSENLNGTAQTISRLALLLEMPS